MQPNAVRTQEDLIEISGADPCFRYDIALRPGEVAYEHLGAVALHTFPHFSERPPRFTLLGGQDQPAAELLDWVANQSPWGELYGVSIERHREPLLHQHFQVGQGGDWDWLWTSTSPPREPAEELLVELDDDADAAELLRLNETGNPTAESEPGTGKTQRWLGVRVGGAIVAAAALHRSDTGHGVLTGIVTHPLHRGHGYGSAMTAALTRQCVEQDGVATLGMYADNDTARRLYERLGYRVAHRFASRRLAPLSRG